MFSSYNQLASEMEANSSSNLSPDSKGQGISFKQFDQSLHDAHDLIGKRRVAHWIASWGMEVVPGTKYGIDLLVYRNGDLYAQVEVEQRDFGGRCPYETIHVAIRKHKFFQSEIKTLLFAVDMAGQWAYYTDAKRILNSPVKEIQNKFVRQQELFYDVAIDQFTEIRIDQNGYGSIKRTPIL